MLKWKVSAQKLSKACRETFDLEHRVLIRPLSKFSGDKDMNGIYVGLYGKATNRLHIIYIDTNLSKKQANETLWHELTHAYQNENSNWREDFKLSVGREISISSKLDFDEYWNCKPEQHARRMAKEMSKRAMLLYDNKKK